jgi:hypothetical protein
MEDGITADLTYTTLTVDWDISESVNFEAILSTWEQDQRQVVDFDGTEFLVTTDDIVQFRENETMEFHLSGNALDGRISWLAGLLHARAESDTAVLSLGNVRVRSREHGPERSSLQHRVR